MANELERLLREAIALEVRRALAPTLDLLQRLDRAFSGSAESDVEEDGDPETLALEQDVRRPPPQVQVLEPRLAPVLRAPREEPAAAEPPRVVPPVPPVIRRPWARDPDRESALRTALETQLAAQLPREAAAPRGPVLTRRVPEADPFAESAAAEESDRQRDRDASAALQARSVAKAHHEVPRVTPAGPADPSPPADDPDAAAPDAAEDDATEE